jgi:hypothetical protein
MTIGKLETVDIQKNLELLNKKFEPKNLKGDTKNREKVSCVFKKHVMRYIYKNVKCVQKIMTSNGRHSYHFFAPIGFLDYVKNIERIQLLEHANLNTVSAAPKSRAAL